MNDDAIWIRYYEQGKFSQELSFTEANQQIKLKEIELASAGIGRGDRVIVKLPNSPIAAVTYMALYHVGAIVVPVYYKEIPERLDFIIKDCSARALISLEGMTFYPTAQRDKEKSGLEDVRTIIYTSGTTGDPKGVCLSWGNWTANAEVLIKHHGLNENTILASPLPLSHCNAHGLAMISTFMARSRWILFDAVTPEFLDIISVEKTTILSIVPALLYQLHKDSPSWHAPATLKYILTAAAPLRTSLLESVLTDWNVRIVQGYGLSESTNFSCTMPINLDEVTYRNVMFPAPSIGVALSGVEVRIGKDDEPEQDGELQVRAMSNFNGYWTQSSFEHVEWVKTGDLGHYRVLDGKRYYYLSGRIKEFINRGGEKISPLHVESILRSLGMKGEFAIVSIPSDKYGEQVGLVVCERFDVACIEKLPTLYKPTQVFFMKELFYTSTGKLQRRRLADYCNAGNAEIIASKS